MAIALAQQIDANSRTINSNEAILYTAPWTFSTLTTGATGAHTVFTVTGDWIVSALATCSVDLTGAGTIELGVAGNTAALIAQLADATTLDAGEIWVSGTATTGAIAIPTQKILTNANIILTIGTTAITAGTIAIYLTARPLSAGATLSVTTPA